MDTLAFPQEKRGQDANPRFQLFVRWFCDHDDAGGLVELARKGEIILSEPTYNNDRVYGFCRAIVRLLQLSGYEAEMPMWLQGHTGPNRNIEN